MSSNPFESPNAMESHVDTGAAAAKVSVPAILLIVAGILNTMLAVFSVGSSMLGMANAQNQAQQMEELEAQFGDSPAFEFLKGMQEFGNSPISLALNVVGVLAGIVTIVGGVKMKSLNSWGLALTAAIITLVPVFSCCCWGLPIGIWALIVLLNSDVKAAFS